MSVRSRRLPLPYRGRRTLSLRGRHRHRDPAAALRTGENRRPTTRRGGGNTSGQDAPSCCASPHHERGDVLVGYEPPRHIPQSLIDDRCTLVCLRFTQRERWSEFEYVAPKANIEKGCAELVGAVDDLCGGGHRHGLARVPIPHELDADGK